MNTQSSEYKAWLRQTPIYHLAQLKPRTIFSSLKLLLVLIKTLFYFNRTLQWVRVLNGGSLLSMQIIVKDTSSHLDGPFCITRDITSTHWAKVSEHQRRKTYFHGR